MEQLWLELWEQESSCRAHRLQHQGDRTERRRVQEKGRQKGHAKDTKVFVGERKAQGKAQEGGECPEQNQSRGKDPRAWIHVGWGQEEKTQGRLQQRGGGP